MADAYVTSATITNGKMQLTVLVDDFEANEYVEISGQATQTNGAFANFYDIQPVPAEPNVPPDPNVPNDTSHSCVYVTGAPTPHQFRRDEDVSVVARVAKVWLTVLGQTQQPSTGPSETASEGPTWTKKTVSQLNGASW